MLRRLLALIAARQGVCSYDELARELGVSQGLVEQLVADLLRSGCLRMAFDECVVEGCTGCPLPVGAYRQGPSLAGSTSG
jgi:hypothetical protein